MQSIPTLTRELPIVACKLCRRAFEIQYFSRAQEWPVACTFSLGPLRIFLQNYFQRVGNYIHLRELTVVHWKYCQLLIIWELEQLFRKGKFQIQNPHGSCGISNLHLQPCKKRKRLYFIQVYIVCLLTILKLLLYKWER